MLERPEIGLWAVADGMGGYGGGDVASRAVVERCAGSRRRRPPPRLPRDFEARIADVNRDLRATRAGAQAGSLIGTTLVAMLIFDAHFACVWCGDSRAYLLRGGVLTQISRDHSEVQDLIDRGVLGAEEARTWPRPQRGDPRARRDRPARSRDRRRPGGAGRPLSALQRRTDRPCLGREIAERLSRDAAATGLRRLDRADVAARRDRQCLVVVVIDCARGRRPLIPSRRGRSHFAAAASAASTSDFAAGKAASSASRRHAAARASARRRRRPPRESPARRGGLHLGAQMRQRVDRRAVEVELEVQMRPGRQARVARKRDRSRPA